MLYPPQIDGIIPSFSKTSSGFSKLIIPFEMNKTVSKSDITGFSLLLKGVVDSSQKYNIISYNFDLNEKEVIFKIDNDEIQIGEFYKAQIAYIDNNETIGYYSSIGVVKCTGNPTVIIEDLSVSDINTHIYYYQGVYTNEEDTTEKVASYRFLLQDNQGNIYKDTGYLIHNSDTDIISSQSSDYAEISFELEEGKTYFLTYTILTNNNLEVTSPKYRLYQPIVEEEIEDIVITPTLNFDNGYIKVNIKSQNNAQIQGKYQLIRTSYSQEYKDREILLTLNIYSAQTLNKSFYDFNILQGEIYLYKLQKLNEVGYVESYAASNKIFADFEDMFLSDGDRQLKVRFNPKVSSFKSTVLETKIETMGSKKPFASRNGIVDYKEFPIAGLISYNQDEENLFSDIFIFEEEERECSPVSNSSATFFSTDLTSQNYKLERDFKLEVLEWLNNGKPKLFRSPAEGNYIVRLLQPQLTPNDTLGRMIHEFSCQAFEIDEYTRENLIDNEITYIPDFTSSHQLFRTIKLQDYDINVNMLKSDEEVFHITIENTAPGSRFLINDESVTVGPTGKYETFWDENIYQIKKLDNSNYGDIIIGYYKSIISSYKKVISQSLKEYPLRQISGTWNGYGDNSKVDIITNIIANIKETLNNFYYLKIKNKKIINDCSFEKYRYIIENEQKSYLIYSTLPEGISNPFENEDGSFSVGNTIISSEEVIAVTDDKQFNKDSVYDEIYIYKNEVYFNDDNMTYLYEIKGEKDSSGNYHFPVLSDNTWVNDNDFLYCDLYNQKFYFVNTNAEENAQTAYPLLIDSYNTEILDSNHNYTIKKNYKIERYNDDSLVIFNQDSELELMATSGIEFFKHFADVYNFKYYKYYEMPQVDSLVVGNGCILYCGYNIKIKNYLIEYYPEQMSSQLQEIKNKLDEQETKLLKFNLGNANSNIVQSIKQSIKEELEGLAEEISDLENTLDLDKIDSYSELMYAYLNFEDIVNGEKESDLVAEKIQENSLNYEALKNEHINTYKQYLELLAEYIE